MLKPEKILQMLDTPEDIAELKSLLEDEIRQTIALKTNDKTRVTQMNKMQKEIDSKIITLEKNKSISNEHDKRLLENLKVVGGCGNYGDGRFVFTDCSMVFILNDSLGYEPKDNYPPIHITKLDDEVLISKEKIADMMIAIKTKKNYDYNEQVAYNYKYLEIFLKILGESDIYFSQSRLRLYFKNEAGEEGALFGIYKKPNA